MKPSISIITPSFNQGRYIERTILSVLNQGYENLEYIVIDGGSTDNTIDILKKYNDQINFWVSEKDRGQSHALNKGLAKASGDIIAWINSDDWYDQDVFNAVAGHFETTGADVVAGNCTMVYEDDPQMNFVDKPGRIDLRRLLRYWQPFFCPPQPSIFFKRSLLQTVGPVDERLTYAMDLDLWLRMASRSKFSYLDKNLSFYLIHASSKSGSENGMKKFRPEWRKVAMRHLAKASIYEKLFFVKGFIFNR